MPTSPPGFRKPPDVTSVPYTKASRITMALDKPTMSAGPTESTSLRDLMTCLVVATHKSARLCRACRKEQDLFQLLVQKGSEKNPKFNHDFKTLADVLIQETLRHDVGTKYPKIASNIRGEENNRFTNTLGETIEVRVCDTESDTAALLSAVLDGHTVAAELLAKRVHSSKCELDEQVQADLQRLPQEASVNLDEIGIWIDPIDSTNNYVYDMTSDTVGDAEMCSKGLQVVTVLVGVFSLATGQPIAGVVNQPFAEHNTQKNTWRGQLYWGVSYMGQSFSSSTLNLTKTQAESSEKPKIVVSFSESAWVNEALSNQYQLFPAGGAGYKLLCVAMGWVKLYVTLKSSTYKWDSCAGHAILLSLGGKCFEARKAVESTAPSSSWSELQYSTPRPSFEGIERWCNEGGVVAFRGQDNLSHAEAAVLLVKEAAEAKATSSL